MKNYVDEYPTFSAKIDWILNPLNLKCETYADFCGDIEADIRRLMKDFCLEFEVRAFEVILAEVQSIKWEIEEGTGEVLRYYWDKLDNMKSDLDSIVDPSLSITDREHWAKELEIFFRTN